MALLEHKITLKLRVIGLKSDIYFVLPFLGIITTKVAS